MKGACLAVVVLASTTIVEAGPLADALAKKDVAVLRAEMDANVSARCTLAAVYAKKADLTRASIYMRGCANETLDPDIATDVAKILKDTKKKLDDGDLHDADLQSTPDGLLVEIDALPGEKIITPVHVFLKPGVTYNAQVTHEGTTYKQTIDAKPRMRGPVMFITRIPTVKKDPKTQVIDMTENSGGGEVGHTAGPKDVKHPPLMSEKFQGITHASGPQIEDPLALGPMQRHDREWSIGGRIGGGVFDDAGFAARPGLAIAAVGRVAVAPRIFVDARLDWSRRGGDALMDHAVDTIGATPELGVRLVDVETMVVSMCAGPRIDLHLQDRQDTQSISRIGISAAAGLDVALQSVPITAGVRFERGLSAIATGRHDQALLLEVGWDWR